MPHCSTGDDGRFAKIFISKISMKTLIGKFPRVFVQALSIGCQGYRNDIDQLRAVEAESRLDGFLLLPRAL